MPKRNRNRERLVAILNEYFVPVPYDGQTHNVIDAGELLRFFHAKSLILHLSPTVLRNAITRPEMPFLKNSNPEYRSAQIEYNKDIEDRVELRCFSGWFYKGIAYKNEEDKIPDEKMPDWITQAYDYKILLYRKAIQQWQIENGMPPTPLYELKLRP
jgi:hypothetical protein